MPSCCVPYCTSHSKLNKKNGTKHHFFSLPKDIKEFDAWERRIRLNSRALTSKDRVCSVHFEPECIIDYIEIHYPNDRVERIARKNAKLKPGSVPSKFPDFPRYLQPNTRRRKSPKSRGEAAEINSNNASSRQGIRSPVLKLERNVKTYSDHAKQDEYELTPCETFALSSESRLVSKDILDFVQTKNVPPEWTYCANDLGIFFLQFDSSHRVSKHVLFPKDDGIMKVFVNNTSVKIENETIESVGKDAVSMLNLLNVL